MAPARRAPAPARRRRAAAHGHRRGRRRPAVVGRRACRPAARQRAGEPHLLVVVDDAAGPGPWAAVAGRRRCSASAPRPVGGPRPRWCACASVRPSSAGSDGAGTRRGRSGGPTRSRRGGRGAGPSPRPLPARGLGRPTPARPRAAGLPALLGLAGGAGGRGRSPRCASAACARPPRRRPAARPVGVDEAGAPVALDLKESAAGRQRTARALHRGHRLGQERAAAHAGARPGGHALVGRAEPRARRLQGRRDLPRPRRACRTSSAVITNLADELHARRPDGGRPGG